MGIVNFANLPNYLVKFRIKMKIVFVITKLFIMWISWWGRNYSSSLVAHCPICFTNVFPIIFLFKIWQLNFLRRFPKYDFRLLSNLPIKWCISEYYCEELPTSTIYLWNSHLKCCVSAFSTQRRYIHSWGKINWNMKIRKLNIGTEEICFVYRYTK